MFLRAEDQGAFVIAGLEQPFYEGDLLRFVHDKGLLDDFGRGFGESDIDLGGVMQYFAGQVADLGGHGRREQEILSYSRQEGDDLHDIIVEAHVQRTVRFVENEVLPDPWCGHSPCSGGRSSGPGCR